MNAIHCQGEYQRAISRIATLEKENEELRFDRDHWKTEACQLVDGDKVNTIQSAFGLTNAEANICGALYHRREKYVPADSLEGLLDEERGYSLESNVVSVLVGKIRNKLGDAAIENLRGRGYRLSPELLARFTALLEGSPDIG